MTVSLVTCLAILDADDECGREMDRHHTETDRRTENFVVACTASAYNASRYGVVNSDPDTTM